VNRWYAAKETNSRQAFRYGPGVAGAKNHAEAGELWIGFYRKSSRKAGTSYAEALCCGWIDGVCCAVDVLCYKIRFTPRNRGASGA